MKGYWERRAGWGEYFTAAYAALGFVTTNALQYGRIAGVATWPFDTNLETGPLPVLVGLVFVWPPALVSLPLFPALILGYSWAGCGDADLGPPGGSFPNIVPHAISAGCSPETGWYLSWALALVEMVVVLAVVYPGTVKDVALEIIAMFSGKDRGFVEDERAKQARQLEVQRTEQRMTALQSEMQELRGQLTGAPPLPTQLSQYRGWFEEVRTTAQSRMKARTLDAQMAVITRINAIYGQFLELEEKLDRIQHVGDERERRDAARKLETRKLRFEERRLDLEEAKLDKAIRKFGEDEDPDLGSITRQLRKRFASLSEFYQLKADVYGQYDVRIASDKEFARRLQLEFNRIEGQILRGEELET